MNAAGALNSVTYRNFRFVGGYDICGLLKAVIRHQGRFGDETARQGHRLSPHPDSETIFLRAPTAITLRAMLHSRDIADWPVYGEEAAFREAVKAISRVGGGYPARAMIIKLKGGGRVKPHIDIGDYAADTERYHLPIVTNDHVLMRCGAERIHLPAGAIWWFDKSVEHDVCNDGSEDRIHLVVDLWKRPC